MADQPWTLSIVLAVVLGAILVLWGKHWSMGWLGPSKSGARLPKGSFGWPLIGDLVAVTRNPTKYASSHAKRYGRIFKTSLGGQPTVMGLTPEFTKFVLTNINGLFARGFPTYLMELLGPNSLMFLTGPRHMSMKKILIKPLLPDALRQNVNTLESIILEGLASWAEKGTVNGRQATAEMTMKASIWLLLGIRDLHSIPEGKELMKSLVLVENAMLSVPVNLPMTPLNRGLKAKVALTKYFKNLIQKRKGQENSQNDMLGALLAAQEDQQAREEGKGFDDDMIADNLVFFWFAAYDTTSNTMTWILKLLLENPEVFRRIQIEQQEILKSKDLAVKGPRLSWEDTRKMVYTQKFFQELQRVVSVSFIQVRKATQDIDYKGHLIPKGWGVGWMQGFIHSDPDIFPEPEKFNPDRFDVTPRPYTYIPFSAGSHACPGLETAKLIALIFIHHLTTSYTYESIGPDMGTEFTPFKTPRGGYPIKIQEIN